MDEEETTEVVDTDEQEAQEATSETEDNDDGDDAGTFDTDKAREKIRKVNSENRNLRKRAAEAEAKAKDSEGKDTRLTALEAENLRLRIGVKHGLPEALVKRLTGTTEEEILQDAEELMELFGGKKPPTQQPREKLRGGGDPTINNSDLDEKAFLEKVFGN